MSRFKFLAFLTLGIFVVCFIALNKINKSIDRSNLEKRNTELEKAHESAVFEFKKGIEKFALIVSAIRAHIESINKVSEKEDLQAFIKNQIRDLYYEEDMVVSFLDTNHVFQYSFTLNDLKPNMLEGLSVINLRDSTETSRLDELLVSDEIRIFPPMNLVEGWAGLPLNFRVKINGTVVGYMAPIVDLKSILDNIYKDAASDGYVFHFSTQDQVTFDRYTIYNGSTVYHENTDDAYFRNFNLKPNSFKYSDFEMYNYSFRLGTAHKAPYVQSQPVSNLIYVAYFLLLMILMISILIGYSQYKSVAKSKS